MYTRINTQCWIAWCALSIVRQKLSDRSELQKGLSVEIIFLCFVLCCVQDTSLQFYSLMVIHPSGLKFVICTQKFKSCILWLPLFSFITYSSTKNLWINQFFLLWWQVVPWLDGTSVTLCPNCAKAFSLTRRKHHCRLCGSILCHDCSLFLDLNVASKYIVSF